MIPESRIESYLANIAGLGNAAPSSPQTRIEYLLSLIAAGGGGGGGGGTTNYDLLTNKPQINGVTLQGNKTLAQLGIASATGGFDGMTGADIDSIATSIFGGT